MDNFSIIKPFNFEHHIHRNPYGTWSEILTLFLFSFLSFQGLFHVAVTRYIAEFEKKDLLLQLLQWMPGQGYVVDSSTRNLILKNSDLFGRQLIAEILAKQHTVSKALIPLRVKK